jgi:hypothetical protein
LIKLTDREYGLLMSLVREGLLVGLPSLAALPPAIRDNLNEMTEMATMNMSPMIKGINQEEELTATLLQLARCQDGNNDDEGLLLDKILDALDSPWVSKLGVDLRAALLDALTGKDRVITLDRILKASNAVKCQRCRQPFVDRAEALTLINSDTGIFVYCARCCPPTLVKCKHPGCTKCAKIEVPLSTLCEDHREVKDENVVSGGILDRNEPEGEGGEANDPGMPANRPPAENPVGIEELARAIRPPRRPGRAGFNIVQFIPPARRRP